MMAISTNTKCTLATISCAWHSPRFIVSNERICCILTLWYTFCSSSSTTSSTMHDVVLHLSPGWTAIPWILINGKDVQFQEGWHDFYNSSHIATLCTRILILSKHYTESVNPAIGQNWGRLGYLRLGNEHFLRCLVFVRFCIILRRNGATCK